MLDGLPAVTFDGIVDQCRKLCRALDGIIDLENQFRGDPQAHFLADLVAQEARGIAQRLKRRLGIADTGEWRTRSNPCLT